MALMKVWDGVLTDKVVETTDVLIVAATILVSVHASWYKYLTHNM